MVVNLKTLSPASKYCAAIGGALFLWIVPVSIKAPKMITFLSLGGAIGSFFYAYRLAETLEVQGEAQAREKLKNSELVSFQYALEEEAIKRELYLQFNPEIAEPLIAQPVEAKPAAEQIAVPKTDKEESDAAQLLMAMVRLSTNYGWLSASAVKQKSKVFRGRTPEEIRDLFLQLADGGIGQTRGDGDKLEWAISPT
jgi:hypothetical protein